MAAYRAPTVEIEIERYTASGWIDGMDVTLDRDTADRLARGDMTPAAYAKMILEQRLAWEDQNPDMDPGDRTTDVDVYITIEYYAEASA